MLGPNLPLGPLTFHCAPTQLGMWRRQAGPHGQSLTHARNQLTASPSLAPPHGPHLSSRISHAP
jgi:hypothetical protein